MTPEDAIKAIGAFADAVPIERFYCWTVPPGYPVRKMDEHLELMAMKVIPHFRLECEQVNQESLEPCYDQSQLGYQQTRSS